MMLHHLPVIDEADTTKGPEDQLLELVGAFGHDGSPLPVKDAAAGDLRVDVAALAASLPDDLRDHQANPAKRELRTFYYAVDPKLRRRGVFMPAEPLVSLLIERLEFFEHLSRNVARICSGKTCPHFRVCRFKDVVVDVTEEDGVLCSVERELVKHYTREFVTPEHGKPSVDPRRVEMAFSFHQLMQLVVQQVRYAMYMQVEDLKVKQYDKLRQADGSEVPVALNDAEHPLMAGWQKTTKEIQNVLQKMGRTPEFMQRQGLLVDEGEKADAEARALELTRETFEHMLAQTTEDSEGHVLLTEALKTIDQLSAEEGAK
jgi:hypothetical protein